MLLVDHDEAEVRDRGEDRRAGPDDDRALPVPDLPPRVVALPGRQGTVEHGHPVAEVGPEPTHGLGREGDLRDEDQGPPPLAERPGHEADVDEGLAASGHAVEEVDPEGAAVDVGADGAEGGALCFRGPEVRGFLGRLSLEGGTGDLARLHADKAPLLQPADEGAVEPFGRERGGRQAAPGPVEPPEALGLPGRAALQNGKLGLHPRAVGGQEPDDAFGLHPDARLGHRLHRAEHATAE